MNLSYDEMVQKLRGMLEAHYAAVGGNAAKDTDAILAEVKAAGGTSAEAMAHMTPADLTELGVPKLLARSYVTAIMPVAPRVVVKHEPDGTPAKLPEDLSEVDTVDLVAALRPERPGRVGAELLARAKGRPFMLYVAGILDREATTKHVSAIERNRPTLDMPIVQGKPTRPRMPGESPKEELSLRNPLFGNALVGDEQTCTITKESYVGVPLEVRVLLIYAVETRELRTGGSAEIARAIIRDAKSTTALVDFARRYPAAAERMGNTPKERWPSTDIEQGQEEPAVPFVEAGAGSRPTPARPKYTITTNGGNVGAMTVGDGATVMGSIGRPTAKPGAPRVVAVYDEADAKSAEKLRRALSMLISSGRICYWDQSMISAGRESEAVGAQESARANIALVLISSDMVATICSNPALANGLQHVERVGGIVIPVLLRTVDLRGTMFERLQAIPYSRRPMVSSGDIDGGMAEVAIHLREMVEAIEKGTLKLGVKAFRRLDATAIYEIHGAMISAKISTDACLGGVEAACAAGIGRGNSDAEHLIQALNYLNGVGVLPDGSVPLHTFLATAVRLAGPRRESAVLEKHLTSL